MWRVWVRRGGCIGSWWGNRREGENNEIYLLTKYIKRVFWGVAVRLSCIEDTLCLKVNVNCNIVFLRQLTSASVGE